MTRRWNHLSYPNRTVCSVIEEARKCHETRNYSYLPGILEELQNLANRMEAALEDIDDLEYAREQTKKLQKELNELEDRKEKLSNGSGSSK